MCFRDRHGMEGLDEYEIFCIFTPLSGEGRTTSALDEYEIFCIFTPLGIFYSRRIYNEIHKENSRRKTFFLAEG